MGYNHEGVILEDYPAWLPVMVTVSHHATLSVIPNQRVTLSNTLLRGQ